MQAGGGPQIDLLAVVADGGIDDAEIDKIVGGQAALLAQLALGGLKRVLVRLELTGGQLPDLLAEGVAELTYHRHAAVGVHRQDAGAAVVVDDLPRRGRAVLKLYLVHGHADDAAIEDFPAFQHGLGMCHCFSPLQKGPAVQAGPILLLFYSRRRQ